MTERRYVSGQLAATERWTAILSVVIETPRDADHLRKNPLAVYVNCNQLVDGARPVRKTLVRKSSPQRRRASL